MENITFNFTLNEVNVILLGLAELPLKISVELHAKVKLQAEEQLVLVRKGGE